MANLESQLRTNENPQAKEILVPLFGGLTVSGKSGTGKTSTMEALANLYRINPDRRFKGGQAMRGETNIYKKRAKKLDINVDQNQRDLIQSADPTNPFIDEGRLAGFLATEELSKNPDLRVVRILFVASSAVRMSRLLKRRKSDNFEEIKEVKDELEMAYSGHAEPRDVVPIQELLESLISKKFSLGSIKEEERKREADDMAQWKRVHPKLQNISDIFNPSYAQVVINPDGEDIFNKPGVNFYDFAINTNGLTVEETAKRIDAHLRNRGLIDVVTVPALPQNGVIYQT